MYGSNYQQTPYDAPPGQYPPPGHFPPQGQPFGAPVGYSQSPGQYGGPPGQYGAPPGQYGPPFNQYGPPPGLYGGPPGAYGAPPAPYGAPAPGQFAPPPPPSFGAGGPAGLVFLGVPVPAPPPAPPVSQLAGYNPQFDAERIRKATKGFGTDERALIDTLAPLDAFQVDILARTYEQLVGRSLQKTLEKELSGWLEYTLVLVALGPLHGDLHLLHRAMSGAGTHEDLLTELLIGRTNAEMFALKEGYRRVYGKDLLKAAQGELSAKTERLFNMAISGTRDETPYIDGNLVQQDVEALYRAGPGKIGTDEIAICGILLHRSDAHLATVAQAFSQRHRVALSHMIQAEFSGHMRTALLHVAQGAESDGRGVARDAALIGDAMSGAGTKDERLCYRIVRAHWDRARFAAIKQAFQATHRRDLRSRVETETSGKYERALVAIIAQV
ncbi:Annexin C1 [Cryptotrichosporon argae]